MHKITYELRSPAISKGTIGRTKYVNKNLIPSIKKYAN